MEAPDRGSFRGQDVVYSDRKLEIVACLVAGKKGEQNRYFQDTTKEGGFGQGATHRPSRAVRPRFHARSTDLAPAAAGVTDLRQTARVDHRTPDSRCRVRGERPSTTRPTPPGGPPARAGRHSGVALRSLGPLIGGLGAHPQGISGPSDLTAT